MQIKSQVAKSFGRCLARVGCPGVNGSIILYNILQPSFTEYVSFVLRYPETKDRFLFVCLFFLGFFFFNLVISVISVVLRETTLSISVSTSEPVSMKSEIERVVSLSITEMSEITRLKIPSSGKRYLNTLLSLLLLRIRNRTMFC